MSVNTNLDNSLVNQPSRDSNISQISIINSGDIVDMIPFQTTGGIIVLTQAAYDILPSGEANTLYVISG